MIGKKVSCPVCKKSRIAFYYAREFTIFYCQNPKCDSVGKQAFKSRHWSNEEYPKIIEIVDWNFVEKQADHRETRNAMNLDDYIRV